MSPRTAFAACVLAMISPIPSPTRAAEADHVEYAIAVHGGAGAWASITEEDRAATEAELRRVVALGRDRLAAGESSLDVVERVVAELEDSLYFNAGRGATFNALGQHELDASIMDGRNLDCGAVAGVSSVKNPVKLARAVMAETKHVMLIGAGADAFAKSHRLELVAPEYFWTPRQRERLQKWQARHVDGARAPAEEDEPESIEEHHGTVGCVALDRDGHLAAATSTGGLEGKLPGRIGDSPVIGAGTYADDATCAVSCTGVGEEFIRRAVAYDIAARMRYADSTLEQAVSVQFDERLRPNDGGLIAVDRNGRIAIRFNTAKMARAAADSTGRLEATLGR
ncbi:MAG TPA: isoaspartyl peptidase/L-asparaginase [Lacipirellula sp.]